MITYNRLTGKRIIGMYNVMRQRDEKGYLSR